MRVCQLCFHSGLGNMFIPSYAGNMVTSSFKPFFRDAWGTYKAIPYDVRMLIWDQFKTKCTWQPRYENEIYTIFEKKVTLRIKEHLYNARDLNKKPEWLRGDVWAKYLVYWDTPEFKKKSEKAKKARSSQKGGSLHTGGSMSFMGHRRRLRKLNGGETVPLFEVFEETHKKKKGDGTREGWVEPHAKETYEGFQKGLEDWRQTQPALEDGTSVRPSPTDMTSIWTHVAGGPSKGRVYGLGVLRSSSRRSPFLSNAPTSQNMEEMEVMHREIAELKKKCETSDAKLAKIEKFMMKHMPQMSDDDEETESDDN
ncbi:uncharacterized protein LOC132626297 isoform X2 [Lycium barbarum]|uniref:uncharacterized protein LOC132626297 isoform X2 n=2 Tax=Lycium barbarum TaxID=112863 RepID=UPI00293E2183|nr:uncharacterized protein LOC132626297 isoform X2 [Lycium barbarum]